MGTPRNVVVLCLDTVRADAFDEYATSLTDRATAKFTQCRAASSWSLPSHASMFTGELPERHGVHAYHRDFGTLDPADTFLGALPEHRSIGASANVWAGPAFGFDRLFDEFYAVSPDRRFPAGIDVASFGQSVEVGGLGKYLEFARSALRHDHPVASLANGGAVAIDRLFRRLPIPKPLDDGAKIICRETRRGISSGEEPVVAFANLMDAHGPLHHVWGYDRSLHDAPFGWTSEHVDWGALMDAPATDEADLQRRRYRGLYHAAVEYLDRVVDEFVDRIQAETDRPTAVVITADHGDNLGTEADDGLWGHVESSLSEGLLHVPLVVIVEGDEANTDVVRTPVSHCSLPELVTALARGQGIPDLRGTVRAERIGHSGRLADVADRRGSHEDRMLRCVYRDHAKVVWNADGPEDRFELDPDRPSWQRGTGSEFDPEPFDTEHFQTPIRTYESRVKSAPDVSDIDEATERRLADLGYR